MFNYSTIESKMVGIRNYFIFFLILFVSGHNAMSQSVKGRVLYKASILDSTDLSYISDDVTSPVDSKFLGIKSGKDAVPIHFVLLFTDKESLYEAENDFAKNKELGLLLNQTNLVGRQSFKFYTNIETEENIFQSYWTKNVVVTSDVIHWKMTKERKKIGRYTVYKATAIIDTEQTYGMNLLNPVVAWYTPEIPIPFGIQNYVGLPGLTLELIAEYQDGKIQYLATEIDLNNDAEILIEKPVAKKIMSEQEYVRYVRKLNANRGDF